MRDHGGSSASWFGSHRDGEQWLDSEYVLMVNTIIISDGLVVEAKGKKYVNILASELPFLNKVE